jgi:hypothetical protein
VVKMCECVPPVFPIFADDRIHCDRCGWPVAAGKDLHPVSSGFPPPQAFLPDVHVPGPTPRPELRMSSIHDAPRIDWSGFHWWVIAMLFVCAGMLLIRIVS